MLQQHPCEFDTSVAAEGFRQMQTANEHSFSQEQHDAWIAQFLANARKAFGLPFRQTKVANLAQELEQRGYFGFAHYIKLSSKKDDLHLTREARLCAYCRSINEFNTEDQALAGIFSPQLFIF